MAATPKLGDLLLDANLIDEVQLKIALEEQKLRGTRFGSTLLSLHFVDENVLTAFLSRQFNMPCVSFTNLNISPSILARVPHEVALKYQVIPIKLEDGRLSVAICDPLDIDTIEALETMTGLVVLPMVAPQSSIEEAIERYYSTKPAPSVVPRGEASFFPDLLHEIEDMELFGDQFKEIRRRLEHIEAALEKIIGLMDN